MKYILILCYFSVASALCAQGQALNGSPASLTGAAKQQFLDSTLKNAGATSAQVQQFNAAKNLAASKAKQIRLDSVSTPPKKDSALRAINDQKNASYRSVLGNDTYKSYNGLKHLKLSAQQVEISKPSPNKLIRDCLDSAGASSNEKQQFMQIKKVYKDSVKAVMSISSLSPAQKKEQKKVLVQHKNGQYLQLLGQIKYARYNLAKKRRSESGDN